MTPCQCWLLAGHGDRILVRMELHIVKLDQASPIEASNFDHGACSAARVGLVRLMRMERIQRRLKHPLDLLATGSPLGLHASTMKSKRQRPWAWHIECRRYIRSSQTRGRVRPGHRSMQRWHRAEKVGSSQRCSSALTFLPQTPVRLFPESAQ